MRTFTVTPMVRNSLNLQNKLGFKTMCYGIYSNLSTIYDDSSPYWPLIMEIIKLYEDSEKIYDHLAEKVAEIEKIGSAWDFQYQDAMNKLERREEARRNYDHYDQKILKLLKRREERIARGQKENNIEYYERVI
jgi:hypothetical protein